MCFFRTRGESVCVFEKTQGLCWVALVKPSSPPDTVSMTEWNSPFQALREERWLSSVPRTDGDVTEQGVGSWLRCEVCCGSCHCLSTMLAFVRAERNQEAHTYTHIKITSLLLLTVLKLDEPRRRRHEVRTVGAAARCAAVVGHGVSHNVGKQSRRRQGHVQLKGSRRARPH